MKSNPVIDLSWNRKQEIRWLGTHEIDLKLLFECAYYPKPPSFGETVSGCVNCTFENPRKSCPHSHILTLTPQRSSKIKLTNKLMRELEVLSEEEREAVEQFLRERRK